MDYPYLWPVLVHVRLTNPIGEKLGEGDYRWCQEDEDGSEVGGEGTGGAEEQGMRTDSEESDEQVGLAMVGRRERAYSLSRALARCWDLLNMRPEGTELCSWSVIHGKAGEK